MVERVPAPSVPGEEGKAGERMARTAAVGSSPEWVPEAVEEEEEELWRMAALEGSDRRILPCLRNPSLDRPGTAGEAPRVHPRARNRSSVAGMAEVAEEGTGMGAAVGRNALSASVDPQGPEALEKIAQGHERTTSQMSGAAPEVSLEVSAVQCLQCLVVGTEEGKALPLLLLQVRRVLLGRKEKRTTVVSKGMDGWMAERMKGTNEWMNGMNTPTCRRDVGWETVHGRWSCRRSARKSDGRWRSARAHETRRTREAGASCCTSLPSLRFPLPLCIGRGKGRKGERGREQETDTDSHHEQRDGRHWKRMKSRIESARRVEREDT